MKDSVNEYLLLSALRHAIDLRNSMNLNGLSDNFGALSSVEYLLEILSLKRKYGLTKAIHLKSHPLAEGCVGVSLALSHGSPIRVQHINTSREWALSFIYEVSLGLNDEELLKFIDNNYRLVLVTVLQSRVLRSPFIKGHGIHRLDYIGLKLDTIFRTSHFESPKLIH
jgi:hypothetical protein